VSKRPHTLRPFLRGKPVGFGHQTPQNDSNIQRTTVDPVIVSAPAVNATTTAASPFGFDWASIFRRLPFILNPILLPYDIESRILIGNRNTNFAEDWADGTLPRKIDYGPTSPETLDMQQSPGAELLRGKFYAEGGQYSDMGYGHYDAYRDTVMDPSYAHSTVLQVGGFFGTATNNGNGTVTFQIFNPASARSFFYQLRFVPNNPFGSWGPMHTVDQTFTWTEPYNPGP
jgi:hypothetical protein